MTPDEFVELFGRERASAILRTSYEDAVEPAMQAVVDAGFRIIEFTLTVPSVYEQIAAFAARDGLVVGAGTVLTSEEAERAVQAGARFLVSPVCDPEVIETARRLGVAMMPGTHTPTEMLRAHRAGAQLQKLFPAAGTGPQYVQQILGPMPFLRIVPTSGVTLENVAAYLRAGAHAVGFVAALFDAGDIAARRFDAIRERGRRMLNAARTA